MRYTSTGPQRTPAICHREGHRIGTTFIFFCAGLALLLMGDAQATDARSWQRMPILTASQVAARWNDPPPEYGPEPYFDLSGSVSRAEVERDLDPIKALGFRAITAQAGRNLPFKYLSPEYFNFYKMLVAEAERRGMRVWIVDDIGYPNGFAGGKFSRIRPDLRMQTLGIAESIPMEGGDTLNGAMPRETVAVTAMSVDGKILWNGGTHGRERYRQ